MYNVLELLKLSDMLRQLDLEKNSNKTIKEVLDFIADKIEDYVNSIGVK